MSVVEHQHIVVHRVDVIKIHHKGGAAHEKPVVPQDLLDRFSETGTDGGAFDDFSVDQVVAYGFSVQLRVLNAVKGHLDTAVPGLDDQALALPFGEGGKDFIQGGKQLLFFNGLQKVVRCLRLEGGKGVIGAGGQIQDLAVHVPLAEPQAQLDAVEPGHQHIQNIDIKAAQPFRLLQQVDAVVKNRQAYGGGVSVQIFPYVAAELLPAQGIVVADRYSHRYHPISYSFILSIPYPTGNVKTDLVQN